MIHDVGEMESEELVIHMIQYHLAFGVVHRMGLGDDADVRQISQIPAAQVRPHP